MTAVRDWDGMREQSARLLERATGQGVDVWNDRVAAAGFEDEAALRAWLHGHDVRGYAQMLLVYERFGYPDFFTAGADELIAGQYADRPALRPVLDRVLDAVPALGSAAVQARKTYVTLLTPRRTFAVVRATTRTRVDLGLRLDGQAPGGRLLAAGPLASNAMTVRIALQSVDDVDAEVLAALQRAHDANL